MFKNMRYEGSLSDDANHNKSIHTKVFKIIYINFQGPYVFSFLTKALGTGIFPHFLSNHRIKSGISKQTSNSTESDKLTILFSTFLRLSKSIVINL